VTVTRSQQLALEGMALADGAASMDWKQRWDLAIRQLAKTRESFTAEDVREIAGDPTDHPNAIGARFAAASKSGLIRPVGIRKARRDDAHARVFREWRGVV
jgi:hypothetical protein